MSNKRKQDKTTHAERYVTRHGWPTPVARSTGTPTPAYFRAWGRHADLGAIVASDKALLRDIRRKPTQYEGLLSSDLLAALEVER